MIVMGCNSGVLEAEQGKNKFLQSLVNVSNEFLNVFTSFGEMVGSVLGLNLESKKSDVGNYFKKVQGTVERIKIGLNKIVAEMKKENNPNAEATETAVKTLVESKLDKIIAGAKEASEAIGVEGEGKELLGNIANNAGGTAGDVTKLIKGIKGIVDVVLKGVGKADAGDDKKADDLGNRTAAAGEGEAGKLFGNAGIDQNPKKVAADAAKAVGGVRGVDILQAMVKENGDAAKLAKETAGAATTAPKDATIAGGIVLRAISKDGKFAGPNNIDDAKKVVEGTAVSAVIKALDALTVAIRRTIDEGLKSLKEAMKINTNTTPVASGNSGSGSEDQ
ncbi:Variable outer membrane protein [Borrelia duttonii CR2A]|uniref:Variable large protein n=1 Tax=Borrelia duttonii CR2A TaxID=1432657 RepID=W6TFS1_9SPIR|nr:Variable outer membrane protein [Borrelia duttonii CR2A]